jgi:hypothetical protein
MKNLVTWLENEHNAGGLKQFARVTKTARGENLVISWTAPDPQLAAVFGPTDDTVLVLDLDRLWVV